MKKYCLFLIIPTYREELRIKRCIEESLFFFRNNSLIKSFEIIFVADKSGDKTIQIIGEYQQNNPEIKLIVNPEREQKGGSVKIGMLSSKYDILLFYDVDLSTPLYEINNFFNYLENYEILVASRGMKDSKVKKKLFKSILSFGFSFLKRILFNLEIKDTQCGFKMFKRNTLIIFEKQTIKTSHFDVELLYLATKLKFKIKEIPVTWIDSDASNFNWYKQIFLAISDLLKIKINYLRGTYKVNK